MAWWLPFGRVPEINPQTLHHWLEEGRSIQLVDARTSFEYEAGTIADAFFAPLADMPGSLARIKLDSNRPVVALCLTGHRSIPAVRILRQNGIEAYSLKGGIMAWKQAGYPLNLPIHSNMEHNKPEAPRSE